MPSLIVVEDIACLSPIGNFECYVVFWGFLPFIRPNCLEREGQRIQGSLLIKMIVLGSFPKFLCSLKNKFIHSLKMHAQ